MEVETKSNPFIRRRSGSNVFAFRCPLCGTTGELGVPDGNRNRLVPCPSGCGAHFMARCGRGFFAKPTLEFAFGPVGSMTDDLEKEQADANER